MGKVVDSVPLITWRDGRPRFSPGPRLRKAPFSMKGEDLRHGPKGEWFTLEEAKKWSQDRQDLIAAIAGATPKQARRIRSTGHRALSELFCLWFEEPRMKGNAVVQGRKHRRPLSANTIANYKKGAKRIEELDGSNIWHTPAIAMTPIVMAGVFDRIEIKHGLASARGTRSAVSAMFSWAMANGHHKGQHPVKAMEQTMPLPEARIRFGMLAEMQHLVAAADALGRPEIGDSIMLGLWTGQRQNDRLALVEEQQTDEGIVFRQHKKRNAANPGGQPLLIPPAPPLRARLNAIRQRRRDWAVTYPQLVVDERARGPFKRDWYVKTFARVRDFAATGKAYARDEHGHKTKRLVDARHEITGEVVTIEPMPSLADFRDQDLRDTAVTWLALASCTVPQIASITGHSLKTIEQVLKHYLGMHPELARSAIARLVAWHEEKEEGN